MKSKILILTAVAVIAALASCKKSDPADPADPNKFEVEGISLTGIPVAGVTKSVKITSNVAWAVTGMTEWCEVEPASGTGDETVTVTVKPNAEPDERSAKLTVTATGFTPVEISVTQAADNVLNSIKDAKFKEWIQANLMEKEQTALTFEQAAAVKEINITGEAASPIASLAGLENFTGLTKFQFTGVKETPAQLTELIDFSSLTKLTNLRIENTTIETLSVKNMPELSTVQCSSNNNLKTITLEDNPKLRSLNCSVNPELSKLTLSGSPLMEGIYVNHTKLGPEFDVSGYMSLTHYIGNSTGITTLYVWWDPKQPTPEQVKSLGIDKDCTLVQKTN